ncbi:MAG TPA: hypothetical protein VGP19_14085 [Candidatus Acidoferrales bacterium]|jgi:hypothetical protein|nr:hypothetical protein [Candidatus Acidoferrales bacterium]
MFFLAALVSLHAMVPRSGYGQSQSAPVNPPTARTSTPASTLQPQAPPIVNAKPAKVWTNDEIDTLRNNPGVSVVGNRAPQKASASSKGYSLEKDPAWYRKQLEPLRAEIEKLGSQIEKTKDFLNGEKVNEPAPIRAYVGIPGNAQDQLKQLENRRQADEAKIDDLLDRARHNGVEPGALR